MSDPVIQVEEVTLRYLLGHNAGSLKEMAAALSRRQRAQPRQIEALRGVSFTVEAGEVLGVIGHNGAGKSTLLKLLARVLPPTSGRVRVRGAISPLIELGAAFNVEQTGRENILLYGTLLGRSPRFMRERCEEIAAWAELSEYLDVPVRAYSSGMVARLAFSVAVDVRPKVLLLDEILSVGDDAFQTKSSGRIDELVDAGAAVVLVSHNMPQVLDRADRVLWLDHGQARSEGKPDDVVEAYLRASRAPGQPS